MSGRDDRRPAPEQVPDPQRDGAVVGSGGVWVVWRQDDHGNRYEVARHDNRAAAQRQADELEARGHKQIYWVARGA